MSQVGLCPHGASILRIILGDIYSGPVTLQDWNKDFACIDLLNSHLSPKRWGFYLSLRGRELQLAHFIPAISIGTGLGAWFQTSSPTSGHLPKTHVGELSGTTVQLNLVVFTTHWLTQARIHKELASVNKSLLNKELYIIKCLKTEETLDPPLCLSMHSLLM